ncbi:MAG TPA: arginine deiminase family protein [Thermoanaerobaculia bacterium]|nr:arginine deiminase family protein [Thermoanaerobaculia bacterium]
MALHVHSEIGRLRRVLIHRPESEIDRMVPAMMEHLLFDDILDGEEARQEHDTFCELLRRLGVETLDAADLLAEALAEDDPRGELLEALEESFQVPRRVLDRLRELPPAGLTEALIGGLRSVPGSRRRGTLFDLLPVPNYFFQRDPQVVLGDRVVIGSMATDAREREPLLARTLFRHHPALAGAALTEIHTPPHAVPDYGPAYPFPTLEGGDVLVVSREVLLVGISERTNRRGVEVLAEYLRGEPTSFRHLIAVELPPRRAFMHLDTVFTVIDEGVCLGYPPVIEAGGPEAARVYSVDLSAAELTFTVQPALLPALAAAGVVLELVPCGGDEDFIEQQREQWTDGANAFAVAPGIVFLYHRNRRTTGELEARGWRLLDEEQALATADLAAGGRTVITFSGRELSRARGGPRCMTMPLERED